MLLQHHGLKSADAVSLSAAIAVNYSLTHLDLCDNRCVLLSASMHRNLVPVLRVRMLRVDQMMSTS